MKTRISHFTVLMLIFIVGIFIFPKDTIAQAVNIDTILANSKGGATYWAMDTLYLGASFHYMDASDSVIVWLDKSDAGDVGALYFMVPNRPDSAYYLFQNKDNGTKTTRVNLSKLYNIPLGSEVFFRYKNISFENTLAYTGQNRYGYDPIDDAIYGTNANFAANHVKIINGINTNDRRYCVAGRIKNGTGFPTDTVQFGFEDRYKDSDFDYNDIIFKVSGLRLTVELGVDSLQLNAFPATATIKAGDSVKYQVKVFSDSLGKLVYNPKLSATATWTLDKAGTTNRDLKNTTTLDSTNVFYGQIAYHTYTITVTVIDPKSGKPLNKSMQVYVEPGDPDHISIVSSSDTTGLLNGNGRAGTIQIGSSEPFKPAYAILRDRYGNFYDYAKSVSWAITSGSTIVDRVTTGITAVGEGLIYKKGPAGTGKVAAFNADSKFPGVRPDTVIVNVDIVQYDALRIKNGLGELSSLTIKVDSCEMLTVEAHRTDNIGWDPVIGNWTSNLSTRDSTSQTWHFCPRDTGTGYIKVTYSGLTKQIPLKVIAGNPHHIVLYGASGNPTTLTPLVNPILSYNVAAGDTFKMYAQVFDIRNNWLSQYSSSSSLVRWTVKELTNTTPRTGIQIPTSGYFSGYSPEIARRNVYAIGTLNHGSVNLIDTVQIATLAGAATQLVIQATPNIDGQPLPEVTLSPTDTTYLAYAILRDKFNNFVGYERASQWSSLDPTIVTAQKGTADSIGQGFVKRITDLVSQTKVLVSSGDGSLKDTLIVKVSSITYTEVAIRIYNGLYKDIDSLDIRTDQDTTLFVFGRRSDNPSRWDNVALGWSSNGSITFTPTAPSTSDKWLFRPNNTGVGSIVATYSAAVTDRVNIRVLPGLLHHLDLYKTEAVPPAAPQFKQPPAMDTLTAGDSLLLVANTFDHKDVWLSDYRNNVTNANKISWRIVELDNKTLPTGALKSQQGYKTYFSATEAYRSVYIIASCTDSGKTILDTAKVYVKPGVPTQLVIESRRDISDLNNPTPTDVITIGPRDTTTAVYAILRDKFGNFSSYSQLTDWRSVDTSIIKAQAGITAYGEGRIFREAKSGTTFVIAMNKTYPSLLDTVKVNLTDVYYDSLRIVTATGQQINDIIAQTGYQTTLYVEGKRSDNQNWEYVPADWHMSTTINAAPLPPSQQESWTFVPSDSGHGYIWVTKGTSNPDTIKVTFTPGDPASVVLYPKVGSPYSVTNQPLPSTSVAINAGDTSTLVAKIFDKNGVWLNRYEIADSNTLYKWKIEESGSNTATGKLIDTTGFKNAFSPQIAYRTVKVIVSFKSMTDTVTFTVGPGPATHLVIEGSQDKNISPNKDNPIDTVFITSKDTLSSVYAILRDKFGNFVIHSKITTWNSLDLALVKSQEANSNVGEGIITRVGTSGTTKVTALNTDPALSLLKPIDSTTIVVLPYYFTELRILDSKDIRLDSIKLSTNDSASLYVQGRRSDDPSKWEDVAARWQLSTDLFASPAAPERQHSWTFSPNTPGKGWIRVTLDNDTITIPDTIKAIFTRGDPIRAQFEILTSPEKLIAGQPIVAVVRIYNKDGLVPDFFCFSTDSGKSQAIYQDTLGTGLGPDPFIIINGDTVKIVKRPAASNATDQCFQNGIDTVTFTLFYAPFSKDSTHQIFANFGNIGTSSKPFVLLPSILDSLSLEKFDGTALGDTLRMKYPDDAIVIIAMGYDKYHNKRGPEPSNWSTSGTLHPFTKTDNLVRVFYDAGSLTHDELGLIRAIAVDSSTKKVSDKVVAEITGPRTQLINAITQDVNGNGLLDHIKLIFDKPLTLDSGYLFPGLTVKYGNTIFTIDSIVGTGATDSVWIVAIHERTTNASGAVVPQTAWEPYISFSADTLLNLDGKTNLTSTDGAGPVVWSVTKTISATEDRSTDAVKIVFSEPIQRIDGNMLSKADTPSVMLYVWEENPNKPPEYIPVDSILFGIYYLNFIYGDSVIVFTTYNKQDLSPRHFISINTDNLHITDKVGTGNKPNENNQLVRVVVIGQPPKQVIPFPNPATATFARIPAGQFVLEHAPNARHWVLNDNAGTVLTFKMMIPSDGTVKLVMKVYDMVGNLVTGGENKDLLSSLPLGMKTGNQSAVDIDIYWNLSNGQGMKCAPGVYQVITYIDYSSSLYHDTRIVGRIGVNR